MSAADATYLFTQLRDLREVPINRPRLSVVAPVFDERGNLELLYQRVVAALDPLVENAPDGFSWELLLVDDGSRDGSDDVIRALHAKDPRVRGVYFAENRGQTTAMATGIHLAAGELVVTIDSDLQNDPADIPGLIDVLGEHDAVVGFRMKRNDSFVKRASSRIANGVRNRLSGDQVRDTGCSLKLFRAAAIQAVPLFEGMHRFLPTLLRFHGFSVIEHGVSHHPRVAGVSKYGIGNRAFRALRDLFAVRWMRKRLIKVPIASFDGPRDARIDRGGRDEGGSGAVLHPPRPPIARPASRSLPSDTGRVPGR